MSSVLQLCQHGGGVPGGSSGGPVAGVEPPSTSGYPHSSGWPIAGGDAWLVGPLWHHLKGKASLSILRIGMYTCLYATNECIPGSINPPTPYSVRH